MRRGGSVVPALNQSFRDFMDGRLPALPGELPTLDDWKAHLGCIYPEVGPQMPQHSPISSTALSSRPLLCACRNAVCRRACVRLSVPLVGRPQ